MALDFYLLPLFEQMQATGASRGGRRTPRHAREVCKLRI